MTAYTPEHLERWTRPKNYAGASWPEYYSSGVGQSRDSDALERSNFRCMLNALGGETDTVLVIREHHWAVGWVEWIAIHETDSAALKVADEIVAALQDYPVINDDDFSEEEYAEAGDVWRDCYDWRERIAYIRNASYGEFEFYDFREMLDCVRGNCFRGYASELLA